MANFPDPPNWIDRITHGGVTLRNLKVEGADEGFGDYPAEVFLVGVPSGKVTNVRTIDTCHAEYGISAFSTGPVKVTDNFGRGFDDSAIYIGTITLSSACLTAITLLVWRRPALRRHPDAAVPAPWAALATTGILVVALLLGTLVRSVNYGAMLLLLRSWGVGWSGSNLGALSYAFGAPVLRPEPVGWPRRRRAQPAPAGACGAVPQPGRVRCCPPARARAVLSPSPGPCGAVPQPVAASRSPYELSQRVYPLRPGRSAAAKDETMPRPYFEVAAG